MPQKDIIHDAVKNALIKDGWTITAEPYTITYLRSQLYADLCAEPATYPCLDFVFLDFIG
jgi:hypothetical protein